MNYRLTEYARQDISEIVQHIRVVQKSPQNARLVATRLKTQFARLVKIPNLGHRREELADERALVVEVTGVLVIYDPTLNPLTILRVVHAARDLNRIRSRPGGK
jgi:toxin ParE1/3/4